MLSYRHAFHAGNHADVLKHFLLYELLAHQAQKDKAGWYIDTHAGAGAYALDSGFAAKNAEWKSGIGRLWKAPDLPVELGGYVDAVRAFNTDGTLRAYPGSPMLAQALLRDQDRMRLFELHGSDFRQLVDLFGGDTKRVKLFHTDGFAGLQTLLPPASRRAVTLMDPSYELKQDYRQVLVALRSALERFATGCYAIWYPRLPRMESRELPDKFKRMQPVSWLHVSLDVRSVSNDGFGMHGSGMFVVNPPWTLPATLKHVLPWLTRTLGEDAAAGFQLEFHIP